MTSKTKLSIVIPCFNEEPVIPDFAKELDTFFSCSSERLAKVDVCFWIVNNNSTDLSAKLLEPIIAANSSRVKLVNCLTQGYGAALKFGFRKSFDEGADYIGFLDLDNTYPLNCIWKLFDKLSLDGLDMVYGARLNDSSAIEIVRKIGNTIYVGLLKSLLNFELSDACSGMRIFKRSRVLQICALSHADLAFSIQLTCFAKVSKWNLGEVSIPYRSRIGLSKLSVSSDGLKFLWVVLRYYFLSIFKK